MWSLAQLLCLFMGFPAVFWKLEIKDIFKNLPSRLGNGTTGIPRAPFWGASILCGSEQCCPTEKLLFWSGLSLAPALVLSWTQFM